MNNIVWSILKSSLYVNMSDGEDSDGARRWCDCKTDEGGDDVDGEDRCGW